MSYICTGCFSVTTYILRNCLNESFSSIPFSESLSFLFRDGCPLLTSSYRRTPCDDYERRGFFFLPFFSLPLFLFVSLFSPFLLRLSAHCTCPLLPVCCCCLWLSVPPSSSSSLHMPSRCSSSLLSSCCVVAFSSELKIDRYNCSYHKNLENKTRNNNK